ncbi:LuxR family transcriptional regulator [Clostridium botulinum]|nr:LuxR family transcriptional regulator [Clostridium botulinum]NFO52365.1 LuxR family transcriptional regulator [Clostridium botulinum]
MIINPESLKNINSEYILNRKRIVKKVDSCLSCSNIVYFFAPIGSGKTIAMNYYVQKIKIDVLWFEMERKDNNNINLFNSLFKILNKFNDNKKRIVVLDSFDLISDSQRLEEFITLINKFSQNFKYIFLSRKKIPACFSLFIAKSMIQVVNSKDLCFNKDEINEFYSKNGIMLSQNKINKLIETTRGWPAILSIFLMCLKLQLTSNFESLFVHNEYVNDFIYKNIWKKFNPEIQRFLIIISLCDEIEINQCKEITGEEDLEDFLEEVMNLHNNNIYVLNPIMGNFLIDRQSELADEEKVDVYKKVGIWYEKSNLNLEAAKYYGKANDYKNEIRNLEKFCSKKIEFKKIEIVEDYIRNLPQDILKNNSTLCATMAFICIIYYKLDEAIKWYENLLNIRDELNEKVKSISKNEDGKIDTTKEFLKYSRILLETEKNIDFIYFHMPHFNNKDMVKKFLEMKIKKPKYNNKFIENISLTFNFPSIINGIRDISSICVNYNEKFKEKKNLISDIYGDYGISLFNLACAEIDYEKDNINKCLIKLTSEIIDYKRKAHIDMLFVAYIIFSKSMIVNGYINEAKIHLTTLKEFIKEKEADYLMKNFEAVYARFNLLNGKLKEANDWILLYPTETEPRFNLLDMYKYFTKARIYIANGEYIKANTFLQIIYKLNYEYNNTYRIAECCILQSIALFKSKDEQLAFAKMEEALILMQNFDYTRIFADEGEACYKVLNNYIKSKNKDKRIDEKYIKKILLRTREFGAIYPKYLKIFDEFPEIYLTKSEIKILYLINKGMSNIEISEYLNIKKDTVKFHTKNIYSKLNVKNRIQAIKVAKEFGIIKEI